MKTGLEDMGVWWHYAAERMDTNLKSNSMTTSFNQQNKTFTVLSSSNLSKLKLNDILFDKRYYLTSYQGWEPVILNERDDQGNLIVKLTETAHEPYSRVEDLARSGAFF